MKKLKGIANISSPLNFKPEHLFEIGKRENNPKRDFLFINKLLGKHIEVSPTVVKATGHLLAGIKYNDMTGTDAKDVYILAEYLKNQSRHNKKDEKYFEEKTKNIVNHHKYVFSNISNISNNSNTNLDNDKNENFKNKRVLVIGFAETATALGMSVAASIKNCDYQSTTRENFSTISYKEHKTDTSKTVEINKRFSFEEEHSHATTHNLYNAYLNRAGDIVCNKDINFQKYSEIILVDDEISTGKTICNIIKELCKETKVKNYSVLSIMDWRNEECKEMSKQLENEENIEIKYYSLMSGNLVYFDDGKTINNTRENIQDNKQFIKNDNVLDTYKKQIDETSKELIFSSPISVKRTDNNLMKIETDTHNYLYEKSGRFLLSSKQINDIDDEINNFMKNHNLLKEIDLMIKNINYNKYNEIKNTIIPKLKKSTALYGNPMERIVYSLEHTLNNNPIENIQKNKHQTKILVLSEGEDMYIPSRIAFYLEEHGYNVKFKTTTRSPIAVDGKTIQTKDSYLATHLYNPYTYENDLKNKKYYFYNKQLCAEKYNLVLCIFERTSVLTIDEDNFRTLFIE